VDAYERQALAMEERQNRRYEKCTLQQRVQFWTRTETMIYETIEKLRSKSKTYVK
jgi:hypothetical protein